MVGGGKWRLLSDYGDYVSTAGIRQFLELAFIFRQWFPNADAVWLSVGKGLVLLRHYVATAWLYVDIGPFEESMV